jgi:hypothetical protein
MPGANYGLSKGFLATGSAAYLIGQAVKLVPSASLLNPAQCLQATAATDLIIGVCQEAVDAAKVTTGKAIVGVAMTGIAKCLAGGVVTPGSYVTADATSRLVSTAVVGNKVVGIALNSANTAAGDIFDVLLTPGVNYGVA